MFNFHIWSLWFVYATDSFFFFKFSTIWHSIEITMDQAIRINCPMQKITVHVSSSASATSIIHPNGKILQNNSLVDIVAHDGLHRNELLYVCLFTFNSTVFVILNVLICPYTDVMLKCGTKVSVLRLKTFRSLIWLTKLVYEHASIVLLISIANTRTIYLESKPFLFFFYGRNDNHDLGIIITLVRTDDEDQHVFEWYH